MILCLLCVCVVQQRLHEQLADAKRISSKSTGSAEQQKDALVKAAAGQDALVVLDGVSFVVFHLHFFIFVVSVVFFFFLFVCKTSGISRSADIHPRSCFCWS